RLNTGVDAASMVADRGSGWVIASVVVLDLEAFIGDERARRTDASGDADSRDGHRIVQRTQAGEELRVAVLRQDPPLERLEKGVPQPVVPGRLGSGETLKGFGGGVRQSVGR